MFSLNRSRDVDVMDMDWEVQRRHITLHDILYPKTFRSIYFGWRCMRVSCYNIWQCSVGGSSPDGSILLETK